MPRDRESSQEEKTVNGLQAVRTVCLASGRGSNFRAVWQGIEEGKIANCQIVALITDRLNTSAELFAREKGLVVKMIDFNSGLERTELDRQLLESLVAFQPGLILALGFMRILTPAIVERFREKIINIHPSLLPAFSGLHAQRQAFDYGVEVSGATVHFIDEGLDSGPIILQEAVRVDRQGSLESLNERILQAEHTILVKAIDLFCRNLIQIEGRKIKIAAMPKLPHWPQQQLQETTRQETIK